MTQDASIALSDLIARRRPNFSLEQPFYTGQSIFGEEMTRIHRQSWLYAGHVSQVENPGDYFLFEIAGDSLIVTRDSSNAINALFNTCRHRGSALCTAPTGHAQRLICPYHQWVYDPSGKLLAARHSDHSLKLEDYSLHRAACEILQGFIFVSLADNPPDFATVRKDMAPFLAQHHVASARIAVTRDYDVHANWKLIVENSRECYHCKIGHPEYARIMLAPGQDDPLVEPESCPAHTAERLAHYHQHDLLTKKTDGEFYFASRYPLARPGAVTESRDGKSVAPLMGSLKDPDAGVMGLIIHPTFMLEATSDYVMTLRFVPIHPTLTRVRVDWLINPAAVEGRDYRVEDLTYFWKHTAEQDWKLCEDNQRGINNSRYTPGPYLPIEYGVEEFIQWYLKHMNA
jgi:phenylpropionate dioxygenase-like ring-hydroxylating dioxygenase large terminal subunit